MSSKNHPIRLDPTTKRWIKTRMKHADQDMKRGTDLIHRAHESLCLVLKLIRDAHDDITLISGEGINDDIHK